MDNSNIMKMFHSQDKLPNYFSCLNFLHSPMLSYIFKQILSLDKLCDNVKMSLCLDAFLVKNEERVIEDTHDAALMSKMSKYITQ